MYRNAIVRTCLVDAGVDGHTEGARCLEDLDSVGTVDVAIVHDETNSRFGDHDAPYVIIDAEGFSIRRREPEHVVNKSLTDEGIDDLHALHTVAVRCQRQISM